jgi:hypothetical protein
LFYLPEDKIVLFQENSLDLKDFYALNRGDYCVGRFTFPSLEQLPRIWNNFPESGTTSVYLDLLLDSGKSTFPKYA